MGIRIWRKWPVGNNWSERNNTGCSPLINNKSLKITQSVIADCVNLLVTGKVTVIIILNFEMKKRNGRVLSQYRYCGVEFQLDRLLQRSHVLTETTARIGVNGQIIDGHVTKHKRWSDGNYFDLCARTREDSRMSQAGVDCITYHTQPYLLFFSIYEWTVVFQFFAACRHFLKDRADTRASNFRTVKPFALSWLFFALHPHRVMSALPLTWNDKSRKNPRVMTPWNQTLGLLVPVIEALRFLDEGVTTYTSTRFWKLVDIEYRIEAWQKDVIGPLKRGDRNIAWPADARLNSNSM